MKVFKAVQNFKHKKLNIKKYLDRPIQSFLSYKILGSIISVVLYDKILNRRIKFVS